MSKKLAAKASLIQLPPMGDASATPRNERVDINEGKAKTAPGSMAHFMASQSVAIKEADELRDKLRAFDGAQPVRKLDPHLVRHSRWANRHADSLADAAFAALKSEIASAGGNVQPVKVRPIVVANAGAGAGPGKAPAAGSDAMAAAATDPVPRYELVFGHRRHRACLELGLPVNAMVEAVSDQELFETMDRENRGRKNLSAWEQGNTYRRALDEGLYPSQRKLSESLGVDVSLVSKSLSLARLPAAVLAAFASPTEIQFRWAQPLAEALQKDPDGVLSRADALKVRAPAVPAAQVYAALVGVPSAMVLNRSTPLQRVVQGVGGRRANIARDAQGRVVLRFSAHALDDAGVEALAQSVERLLAES